MAKFEPAIEKTLAYEGGYQDHPSDPGNWLYGQNLGTNYGITPLVYENYFNRTPTKSDMQNLTVSEAKAIYKRFYWDFNEFWRINNQEVANHLFDLSVLHGRWMWIVVRALNDAGYNYPLTQTWNSNLANEINKLNPATFNNLLYQWRLNYFEKIIIDNPELAAFRNGWLARAANFNTGSGSGNWWPLLAAGLIIIPVGLRENKKKTKKR